jgi:hypothetical protein
MRNGIKGKSRGSENGKLLKRAVNASQMPQTSSTFQPSTMTEQTNTSTPASPASSVSSLSSPAYIEVPPLHIFQDRVDSWMGEANLAVSEVDMRIYLCQIGQILDYLLWSEGMSGRNSFEVSAERYHCPQWVLTRPRCMKIPSTWHNVSPCWNKASIRFAVW